MSPIQFDAIDNFKSHVEKQSSEKLGQHDRQPTPEERAIEQQKLREQLARERAEQERLQEERLKQQQAERQTSQSGSNGSSEQVTEPVSTGTDSVSTQQVPESTDGNIGSNADSEEETRDLSKVPRVDPEPPKAASSYAEDMFGGLMYYGEDLEYHLNDISKQMRPYLSEGLFRGAKAYLTYTKGALIDRMTQGQFLAYLLIGAFPPEIKNVIIKEMPTNNGNDIIVSQLKQDMARESSPASLTNIANSVQEISDQMRLMLDADLSREEQSAAYLPSILYGITWLLTDRMDLRKKVSPRLSFNEYLNGEDSIPSDIDSVIRAGEDLRRRLDSKENEARNGNIFNSRNKRRR